MKPHLGTMSETRVWARQIIDQVIADNVHGPVQNLPKEDLLQVRKILREKCPLAGLSAWEKKVIREEFRAVLGLPIAVRPKMRRRHQLEERDILPSMREWARQKGILPKPETASTP
jgi:hypothetical protein